MTTAQTEQVLDAGRALYNVLTAQNGPRQRACLAFRAWDYEKRPAAELLYSGVRSREEVRAVCTKLEIVQGWTDKAERDAGSPSNFPSRGAYGTKVHKLLEDRITADTEHHLKAERSYSKAGYETGRVKGSIRIDVLEEREDGTLCIYDIKTGQRGLALSRVREFALRASKRLEGYRTVIVIEVRPFEI